MGPQTFISFPLLSSLASLGTTLARPRTASKRHHMTFLGHKCAFKGPPTTLGGPHGHRCPGPVEPRFMYYNPRFFQFSDHFPTSLGPTTFFVPDLCRVLEVLEDSPWGLRLSFLSHICLPLACLARP